MNHHPLGRSGFEVSRVGLGGFFTSSHGPGFDETRAAVFAALDAGIDYIDTAPRYADSEEVLGKILREVGTPVVLSTKLGGRPDPFDPQDKAGLHRSFRESLRLLGRDYIDILFVHEPDRPMQFAWWTDPEAVYGPVIEVMDELKTAGLIRATGLGGTTCAEMAHCIRSDRFDAVLTAFNYSVLYREAALEVIPDAASRGMGIVLASVLLQGGLGRVYPDILAHKPNWMAKARQAQFAELYRFVGECGIGLAEMGLRFGIGCPQMSTMLIGAKTAAHIRETVAATEKGPLPTDVTARLDRIAAMVPYRPFEEPMVLPLGRPGSYFGPGQANGGIG